MKEYFFSTFIMTVRNVKQPLFLILYSATDLSDLYLKFIE
jgi:hypothetical protein